MKRNRVHAEAEAGEGAGGGKGGGRGVDTSCTRSPNVRNRGAEATGACGSRPIQPSSTRPQLTRTTPLHGQIPRHSAASSERPGGFLYCASCVPRPRNLP
ncbi:unnamed protein product [Euphydryas editha]|uniref:Uncharacterized protein n=1 Tax=Euphydryas editha TaxID=104508 RepID=A0AAU9UZ64_EUPED|nr:unnamed protein product [Euphydryas editha]